MGSKDHVMMSDGAKPTPPISFSVIRERYGEDIYVEGARLLRVHIPYFDPSHDSYYYVYHYLLLICSILAAGRTPRVGNLGGAICDACGGMGLTWHETSDAVCLHCRGEGNIIRLVIAEEPVIVEN